MTVMGIKTKAKTNVAITEGSDQGLVLPPQLRARTKLVTDERTNPPPTQSNRMV